MLPLFSPGPVAIVLIVLLLTQVIIALVTVYFHRAVSHRAVWLSPAMHRVCRFLSWFLIGMVPREFAAVHRKHHARCDLPEDPHSPVHHGWKRVLFGGLGLYRTEAANEQTLRQYGRGMEFDPWEGFYLRHRNLGILSFGALLVLLMGWPGLLAWGLCMVWIPFWAAGVINGLGHHVGYRNFATDDHSTNLIPWGVWVGGEELHNNHHADPAGAKFSKRPGEIDLGWGWIRLLCFLGLARLRPGATPAAGLPQLVHRRYEWLREFQACASRDFAPDLARQGYRHWRVLSAHLDGVGRLRRSCATRAAAAMACPRLAQVRRMEQGLRDLWRIRRPDAAQALAEFEEWMAHARSTGGEHLQRFCDRLSPPSAAQV